MSAALTSKDCDFEAGVEKLIQNGWAEVAGGLRESLASIFFFEKGVVERMRRRIGRNY